MRLQIFTLAVLSGIWILASPTRAAEADAVSISANIRAVHMPFGTVLDPMFASPSSNQVVGYTRCGDSALWTGAYLASEAFRYKVTQSVDALNNVKAALAGLKALTDITGDNRLARCMVLADSPYAAGIQNEESHNTIHQAAPWIWVDNTSRDQVVGAFFGLGVAFDFVDDPTVKASVSDLATRLIGFISGHRWTPNDDLSNSFELHSDELQMLLQVARHVNPANTVSGPFIVLPVDTAIRFDVQSNSSYFKFNLDYMTLYNLVRLQNNDDNRGAYQVLRDHTAMHQNAFFDAIDRALTMPDAVRDAEMRTLLDQWLQRPRRDAFVDVTRMVQVCGTSACQPVPVPLRPPTDFIWQRDPLQLSGGGTGITESAGIDYILPYWMGRYYGTIQTVMVQSAAAPSVAVTPNSLASAYGANLASGIAQASSQPLPTTLGGVTLTLTDAAGQQRPAPLIYVSPAQINFVVPDGVSTGIATLAFTNGSSTQMATVMIQQVTPALFSANGNGSGVAAATAIRLQVANPQLQGPVQVFQCSSSGCVSVPISLGIDTPVYVSFYGTGIRNRSSLANVGMKINGMSVPVLYAGPAPNFAGLDQVNASLVLSLRGSKEVNVVLTVDGQASNTVTINIE